MPKERRELRELTKKLEEILASEESLKGKLSEALMKELELFTEKLQGVVSATDELLPNLAEELRELLDDANAVLAGKQDSKEAERILREIEKLLDVEGL